jgi:hypothetical protein
VSAQVDADFEIPPQVASELGNFISWIVQLRGVDAMPKITRIPITNVYMDGDYTGRNWSDHRKCR